MNFNLYLPDDLGEQAKAAELKLSKILREAVIRELHRRSKMNELLADQPQTYEVELGYSDGNIPDGIYTGLIRGQLVYSGPNGDLYLTTDRRLIFVTNPDVFSAANGDVEHSVLEAGWAQSDAIDFLRSHSFVSFEFVEACRALGIAPVVEL